LKKLDLTVNFIDDLFCIENLKQNDQLEQLFLVGNPVTEIQGYRSFVIHTLPQLKVFVID
jgi:protein TilB